MQALHVVKSGNEARTIKILNPDILSETSCPISKFPGLRDIFQRKGSE